MTTVSLVLSTLEHSTIPFKSSALSSASVSTSQRTKTVRFTIFNLKPFLHPQLHLQ